MNPRQWGKGDRRRLSARDYPPAVLALVDDRQGGRFCVECRALGIVTPDAEVEGRLDAIRARFPEPSQFATLLAEQGLTPEMLKEEIRMNLCVQKLVEKEIASQVSVSDEARKKFYEENLDQMQRPETVHVRHILVKADEGATPAQRTEARADLYRAIATGIGGTAMPTR